jgi:PleD family two-component response regulator
LVREAVLEIEESRQWRTWVRHLDLVHVERLDDAVAVLAQEHYDAALVDAALDDAPGLAGLLSLRAQAPDLPVILLVAGEDDAFAASAVREGAEDCLPKNELDCASLARALRHAVERHRRTAALRFATLLDAETGAYNRNGLLTAGDQHRRLARRLNLPVSLVVAALDGACGNPGASLPAAVELAAILRLSFADTDLIARLDSRRFAILSLCADPDDLTASVAALRHRLSLRNRRQERSSRLSIRVGTATHGPAGEWSIEELLGRAQSALCENGRSEPVATGAARPASA